MKDKRIDRQGRSTGDGDSLADLRQRLIAQAVAILETQGPDALTLRRVAAAAGVSHMAPYRHFADKDALLAAVAELGFRALSDDMRASAGVEPDVALRLRAFGLGYLSFARRRPALYRLMFGPARVGRCDGGSLTAASDEAFSYCADTVAAVLRARGVASAGEARALAIATWSLVHGLAMLLMDRRISLPDDAAAEQALIAQVLALHGKTFA